MFYPSSLGHQYWNIIFSEPAKADDANENNMLTSYATYVLIDYDDVHL